MTPTKFRLLAIFIYLMVRAVGVKAADAADGESVILSNLNGPDTSASSARPSQAAAQSPAADAAPAAAEVSMEQYKELKLQQAATPNGVNPSTARRYLRVDKATMMQASGL